MQKKENTYWFCGNPRTTDDKIKHDLVKMVIDGMKPTGYLQVLVEAEETLMNTDLTHSREEGIYYISHGCYGNVDCGFVSEPAVINLVKETAYEIYSDIDTKSDVMNEINNLTNQLNGINQEVREINIRSVALKNAKNEINLKLESLQMKLRHLEDPDPKYKVGDYVIAKSPYSGQECVYRVTSVFVDKRLWSWIYNGCNVTNNEIISLLPGRVVRSISAPKQQVGDTVESTVISGEVKSISYDKARDLWKYKVSGKKADSRVTAWVYETELK